MIVLLIAACALFVMAFFVLTAECEHGLSDVPPAVVCTGCDAIGSNRINNTYVSAVCGQCRCPNDEDKPCGCSNVWRKLLQMGSLSLVVGAVFGLHWMLGVQIGFRLQPLLFVLSAILAAAAVAQAPSIVGGAMTMDATAIADAVIKSPDAQLLFGLSAVCLTLALVLVGSVRVGQKFNARA